MRTLFGCFLAGACCLSGSIALASESAVLFQSPAIKTALSQSLRDPQAAKFSGLASHADAHGDLVMCGQVSEKGSRSAYGPFRRFAIFSDNGALKMSVAGRAKGIDGRIDALCAGRPGVD